MHAWSEKVALREYADFCTKPGCPCGDVKRMLFFFKFRIWVAQFTIEFMFCWVFNSIFHQLPMVLWISWNRGKYKIFEEYGFFNCKVYNFCFILLLEHTLFSYWLLIIKHFCLFCIVFSTLASYSERADPSYCKDRITEGANINKSLVTLGIVISTLGKHISSLYWRVVIKAYDSFTVCWV